MSNPMGASPAGGQGNNRTTIIVVVALLILCCCCVAVIVPIAYSCGDLIMGTAAQCSPLLPQ